MLFKNISNGVEVNVSNLKMRNGRIFFSVRGKGCGARFYSRNNMLVLDEEAEDGTYLKLVEGWALAKPARQPKAKASAASDNASNGGNETPKGEDASDNAAASQPASETPASAKTYFENEEVDLKAHLARCQRTKEKARIVGLIATLAQIRRNAGV